MLNIFQIFLSDLLIFEVYIIILPVQRVFKTEFSELNGASQLPPIKSMKNDDKKD